MGMYDVLVMPDGEYAQIKIFDNVLEVYEVGDVVPMPGDYSILLQEGGSANFIDGRYVSWTPDPLCRTIFNKWGRRLHDEEV
jgi:hypothetical protein